MGFGVLNQIRSCLIVFGLLLLGSKSQICSRTNWYWHFGTILSNCHHSSGWRPRTCSIKVELSLRCIESNMCQNMHSSIQELMVDTLSLHTNRHLLLSRSSIRLQRHTPLLRYEASRQDMLRCYFEVLSTSEYCTLHLTALNKCSVMPLIFIVAF
jgi:hypothetical protein